MENLTMKIKEKMHNHEDFELNNAYTEDEESSRYNPSSNSVIWYS